MCCRRKNKVHSVLSDKNVSTKIRNELMKKKQSGGIFPILFSFLVKVVVSGAVSGLAKKAFEHLLSSKKPKLTPKQQDDSLMNRFGRHGFARFR